jgi:hypothetical protein
VASTPSGTCSRELRAHCRHWFAQSALAAPACFAVAVVVASYVPAASAFALSGTNHNETLLRDA